MHFVSHQELRSSQKYRRTQWDKLIVPPVLTREFRRTTFINSGNGVNRHEYLTDQGAGANRPQVNHIGRDEGNADDENPDKKTGVVAVGGGEDGVLDSLGLSHLIAKIRDHPVELKELVSVDGAC